MREEHPSPEQDVRFATSQLLKPVQDRLVNPPGSELLDELVVVDGELLAIVRDGALDVPRSHDLLVWLRAGRGLDSGGRSRSVCGSISASHFRCRVSVHMLAIYSADEAKERTGGETHSPMTPSHR